MHRTRVLVVSGAAAVLFTACNRPGPVREHANLTSLGSLQQTFNVDSGKVRAIFLDGQMLVGTAYEPYVDSKAPPGNTWMLFDTSAMRRADSIRRASHAIALHDVNADHR